MTAGQIFLLAHVLIMLAVAYRQNRKGRKANPDSSYVHIPTEPHSRGLTLPKPQSQMDMEEWQIEDAMNWRR